MFKLTTVSAGCFLDLSQRFLRRENRRSGHHKPGQFSLSGKLALLSCQEQIVLLPNLQVQLVDASLKVGSSCWHRSELRTSPALRFDKKKLKFSALFSWKSGGILEYILNLNYLKIQCKEIFTNKTKLKIRK